MCSPYLCPRFLPNGLALLDLPHRVPLVAKAHGPSRPPGLRSATARWWPSRAPDADHRDTIQWGVCGMVLIKPSTHIEEFKHSVGVKHNMLKDQIFKKLVVQSSIQRIQQSTHESSSIKNNNTKQDRAWLCPGPIRFGQRSPKRSRNSQDPREIGFEWLRRPDTRYTAYY